MDTRKLLLKASDIDNMAGERKTHYLNPNAVRINKSLGDAVGLKHMGVHLIYVEPGRDTTEYHQHHYEEECVYVLSGQGVAVIDGERYPIAQGRFPGLPGEPCRALHHQQRSRDAGLPRRRAAPGVRRGGLPQLRQAPVPQQRRVEPGGSCQHQQSQEMSRGAPSRN